MELLHNVCSLGLLYMEIISHLGCRAHAGPGGGWFLGFSGGEMWKSRRIRAVTANSVQFLTVAIYVLCFLNSHNSGEITENKCYRWKLFKKY